MPSSTSSCLACRTPCLPTEKANLGSYDVHTLCLKCKQCDTRLNPSTAYLWPADVESRPPDEDVLLFCRQHVPRTIYRRSIQAEDLVYFYEDAPDPQATGEHDDQPTPSTPSKASMTSSTGKKKAGITKKSMMTGILSKASAVKTAVLGLGGETRKGSGSARFKMYKRTLRFRGFAAVKGSPMLDQAGASAALVGHPKDQPMDEFDVDIATCSEPGAPEPASKVEKPQETSKNVFEVFGLDNTRRPNAAELAKRPRPQAVVFDTLLAASLVKMLGTETAEQYDMKRTLDHLINGDEAMDVDGSTDDEDRKVDGQGSDGSGSELEIRGKVRFHINSELTRQVSDTDMEQAEREYNAAFDEVVKFPGYKETVRRRRDSEAKAKNRWSAPPGSRVASGASARARSMTTVKYGQEAVSLRNIQSQGIVASRRAPARRHTAPASGGNSPVGSVHRGQGQEQPRTRTRTVSSRLSTGPRQPLSELTQRDPIADLEGQPNPNSDDKNDKLAKRAHTFHGELRDYDLTVRFLHNMIPADAKGPSHTVELVPPSEPTADAVDVREVPGADTGENMTLALDEAVRLCATGLQDGNIDELFLLYEALPLPAVMDETMVSEH